MATKRGISINDYKVKAQIWLTIICIRVSLCTHMAAISKMQAQMVSCILDNIHLDIGKFFITNIKFFKM